MLVTAWAWLDPVFAGVPDENAHAGLVQHFAETGSFTGGTRPGYASTEQAAAITASRSDYVTANRLFEPPADRQSYEHWLRTPFSAAARGDAAGPNPAATNPHLYYVVAALPYKLAAGSDFFTRAVIVRLLGVLFGVALVWLVWALAGELLPEGPGRVVAAAVGGLMPMIGFIEGAVTPDALMYPLWALVFLAGVKVLRGHDRWLIGLGLGTIAAVEVKYQSLALLPGVVVVLAAVVHRRLPRPQSARARGAVVAAAGVAAGVVLLLAAQRGWLGGQARDVLSSSPTGQPLTARLREYGSYIWQFYLPRPSFLNPFPLPANVDFWHIVFQQYAGAFGWHEVVLPDWAYAAFAVVTVALVAGAVRALVVRRTLRRDPWVLAFFAVVAVSLFLSLHWTEYTSIKRTGAAFLQGRYFMPLNPLFALVAGAAVGPGLARWARVQEAAAGALIALLVLADLLSVGVVLERFYA